MRDWAALLEEFPNAVGEPLGSKIPDAELYEFINDPLMRRRIADRAAMGLDKLKETPVVKEVRRRSIADLYWLGKYFTWETNPVSVGLDIAGNKINLATHGPMVEMFVKKDPTKTIGEQDPEIKVRLMLVSRGSFKTTWDNVDSAQWILAFFGIRILNLTADQDLAIRFVEAVRGHFIKRADKPTLMNLYFPEYCADEKELGTQFEFICPLWKEQQVLRPEPTVLASSIESTLSGRHFDVIKAGDVVSNRNSESEMQCAKVIKNFFVNKKMLMTYGYLDINGTRYKDEDLYGLYLEQNIAAPDKLIRKSGLNLPDPRPWELTINYETGTKILVGRGWKLKADFAALVAAGKAKEDDAKEENYLLLFPELLSYKVLKRQQRENEEVFEAQINQNPRAKSTVVFDRTLMESRLRPYSMLPLSGPRYITWDFAFSKKKGRDYSTAAVGIFNQKGQLFILDLVRGRFNHTSLANAVVDLIDAYQPQLVSIEDASGSKFLEPTIIAEAVRRGKESTVKIASKIDWFPPDQQNDAKKMRIAALHPWITSDRLFLSDSLPYLEPLYDEFERCMIGHRNDDIPDVIAQLVRHAPQVMVMLAKKESSAGMSLEEAAWNMLFEENCDPYGRVGYGSYQPPSLTIEPEYDPELPAETPSGNLAPVLGAGMFG